MTTKVSKAKTELGVSIKIVIIAAIFGTASYFLQDSAEVVQAIINNPKVLIGIGLVGLGVTISKLWLTQKPKKKKVPEFLR